MIELSYIIIFEKLKIKTTSKIVSQRNPCFDLLQNSISSLINQTLPLCDLTIYAQSNVVDELSNFVQNLGKNSLKIRVLPVSVCLGTASCKSNTILNKSVVINHALSIVEGQWVAVLPLGDILEPDATFIFLKNALAKPKVSLVYCDQDFYSKDHLIGLPCYKPGFSIDLLYSQNFIGNFFIFSKQIAIDIGGLDNSMSDNWSYDFILRILAKYYIVSNTKVNQTLNKKISNQTFLHISKIIHHQHISNANDLIRNTTIASSSSRIKTKSKQGLKALINHFSSIGKNVLVTSVKPMVYRHDWSMTVNVDEPLVSLIIPTRDGYSILKACIDSILNKTSYSNYEIIVIDNQSVDLKTIKYLDRIESQHQNIRVLSYNKPFNYSDINNFASDHARGSILGFVNNDIEVINPEWLTEMVSHAVRPDIGCVGALLFYPDGTIQHGGVVVGMNGVADHAFKGVDPFDLTADYFDILKSIHNPDAVTAATLLIRKELFNQVNRFDHQDLVVAFNDVDLCLKVKKKGFRNLFTPFSQLVHHESKTRAKDVSLATIQREQYEHAVMKSRWKTHKYEKKHMLLLYSS